MCPCVARIRKCVGSESLTERACVVALSNSCNVVVVSLTLFPLSKAFGIYSSANRFLSEAATVSRISGKVALSDRTFLQASY